MFDRISASSASRYTINKFNGLDLTYGAKESDLTEAVNFTLDNYPALTVRDKLGRIAAGENIKYADARSGELFFVREVFKNGGYYNDFVRLKSDGKQTVINEFSYKAGESKNYYPDFNIVKFGAYYLLFANRKKEYDKKFIAFDGNTFIFTGLSDNRVRLACADDNIKEKFVSFISALSVGDSVKIASLNEVSGIDEYNEIYDMDISGDLPFITVRGNISGEQNNNESWGIFAATDSGKYEIKKYYNTADGSGGDLDLKWFSWLDFYAEQCHIDGELLVSGDAQYTRSGVQPSDPAYGDYWFDTVSNSLKTYDQTYEAWISVETPYIKLSCPTGYQNAADETDRIPQESIDKWNALIEKLHEGDGVRIADLQLYIAREDGTKTHYNEIPEYNTIHTKGTDENGNKFIVISGVLDDRIIKGHEHVGFYREIPDMDYAFTHENRLWGCSSANHEIYASAQGSMWDFIVYDGESYDSWAAAVVSDGDFTGACSFSGYPYFFKRDKIYKIYGSLPSDFSVYEMSAPGAADNRSLAEISGALYYKGANGVYRLSVSSYPELISKKLPGAEFGSCGGKHKDKYILCSDTGAYVYDTFINAWTCADYSDVKYICSFEGITYFAGDGGIYTLPNTGMFRESAVRFKMTTAPIGIRDQDKGTVSHIRIRVSAGSDCEFTVSFKYDGKGEFTEQFTHNDYREMKSEEIPIIPRRCDYFQIRIEGTGSFSLHDISYYKRR